MAKPATDNNVLKTLDDQKPTAFYWRLTLLATLGEFWLAAQHLEHRLALNFVPYNLRRAGAGYSFSGASSARRRARSSTVAALDHFGRKLLLILDAGIYAVGAIMSSPRTPRCCSSRGR